MKSDDRAELSDDSSFEILSSSDEDESTSLYVSTFQDNSFEMLNSFSAPDPLDDEIETSVLQQDMKSDKAALCLKDHLTSHPEHTEILQHSVPSTDKFIFSQGISPFYTNAPTEDIKHSLALCTSDAVSDRKPLPGDKNAKSLSLCKLLRDSQKESEWDKMLQAVRRSGFRNEDRSDFQRTVILDPVVRSERELPVSTIVQALECNANGGYFVEASESALSELYPRRMNFPEDLCPGLKYGLKLYTWFRSSMYLRKILSGAKSSFDSLLKMFDSDENQIAEERSLLKVAVIADIADYMAIVDSFRNTFKGRVILCRCSNKSNSAQPVLPASYKSALLCAKTKMYHARKQRSLEMDSMLVSTVTFLTEIVPKRWQMSTVLYLYDPKLGLNLHNFTQTMPVPDEFIHAAQRLTSEDYPFKDLGYAVTLKEAIDNSMNCDTGEDTQEFLTGVGHYVTLKSAADVLTGMYSKYISRTV